MIKQPEAVSLGRVLKQEDIIYVPGTPSKEEVVRLLAEKLHPKAADFVSLKALSDRLAEVEKLNNVLETGFYIPHAKFPELKDFLAALAVIPQGFRDPASGITVRAVLLLLSPHKPAFFQRHLNMLANLSQLFQQPFIDSIVSAADPAAALEAVRKTGL